MVNERMQRFMLLCSSRVMDPLMPAKLTDIEQRVLGVLMEKALTQPGSYPLTINAILLGANQKQNRDPVVEYAESDIARAVHAMQVKGLVKQAPPSAGARANRFQHHAVEVFHWDRREQAIMTELLLRGRQTAGELRTRAERMTPLPDLEAVNHVLRALSSAASPFVEELPREPGRSANRWRHLLAESGSTEAQGMTMRHDSPAEFSMPADPEPLRGSHANAVRNETDVEHRLQDMEQRLAKLEEQVRRLTT